MPSRKGRAFCIVWGSRAREEIKKTECVSVGKRTVDRVCTQIFCGVAEAMRSVGMSLNLAVLSAHEGHQLCSESQCRYQWKAAFEDDPKTGKVVTKNDNKSVLKLL